MHLAEAAKIQVVPHCLARFVDGELCYLTRRIDRTKEGGKIAMEDMCQLSGRLTEYKYKGAYEQIAKLIQKYSATPQLDLVNYWELVVFCWITGNADMHLKNFSLYDLLSGQFTLNPAYDLVNTHLAIPEDAEELALTFHGKKRRLQRSDFISSITTSGINEKVIDNLYKKWSKLMPKWFELIDYSFLPEDMKRPYKQLILKRMLLLK